MALAGHRHPGGRARHRQPAGLQRRVGAAQGVFREALEERGDDVGAGDDVQLVGDGWLRVCLDGDEVEYGVGGERVFGAHRSRAGGCRAARGDLFGEGAEAVEAYVERGEWV